MTKTEGICLTTCIILVLLTFLTVATMIWTYNLRWLEHHHVEEMARIEKTSYEVYRTLEPMR